MDFLDDIKEEQNKKKTFSYIAFGISMIVVSMFGYVTYLGITYGIDTQDRFDYLANVTAIMLLISIPGFISAIIAFSTKEPKSFVKWFAIIVNGIFVGFAIVSFIIGVYIG